VSTRVVAIACAAVLVAGCSGEASDEVAPAGTSAAGTTAPTVTQSGSDDVFSRIPEIVDELQPAMVSVVLAQGEGSGVVVAPDTIVTNNHVVAAGGDVQVVLADGTRLDASVEATDPLTDLALLRVDRNDLPEATFADELPRVGELAIALGNPLGFEKTATAGIVSGLHRAIPSGGQTPALVDLIQTDAPISPGNSGGALVNAEGEVIGINVAYIPPEARAVALGFAIPAPTVTSVIEQLEEDGEVEHAFLGVRPTDLTPQVTEQLGIDADSGVVALEVTPGSGADEAGLEEGDVIVALEGTRVAIVEDLLGALRQRSPGDEVTLTIVRDGERLQVTATLGDRRDAG
jgi:S1-C subfamily serine protease